MLVALHNDRNSKLVIRIDQYTGHQTLAKLPLISRSWFYLFGQSIFR
jgi:hypothetical protein